ncbi:MAG: hypothetical protein CVV44_03665 [Spirochaetae bacterium HGW-Spirochaetae-1]|jgi:ribosomal protein S18 acetylase RimI-like enzyme|nr:MAG: hypothetical protein CVV44_03665 [Spirochaetae bacterium HGW-Spirochaetae-1]
MMEELMIEIKSYRVTAEKEVMDICYKTGFMGSSLKRDGRFKDATLFAMLFCLYYLRHEPEKCFIACDRNKGDKTVGYIIGTDDTNRQNGNFSHKMMWRIIPRLFMYTWWRYPESFREVMAWVKRGIPEPDTDLVRVYPGHLHVNVLEEYQGHGLGTRLISAFESRMNSLQVPGIHLGTSNHNTGAISFYRKHGYQVLSDSEGVFWRGVDDYHFIIMGKLL